MITLDFVPYSNTVFYIISISNAMFAVSPTILDPEKVAVDVEYDVSLVVEVV